MYIMKKKVFLCTLLLILSSFLFTQTITETFTTEGEHEFTIPPSIISLTVECWGAGGAGGGSNEGGAGAGGGGGGAYASRVVAVSQGQTYPINVGTGGVGVLSNNGGDGTASSFNSGQVVAAGGRGGIANASGPGGFGGSTTNSVGDIIYQGGNGAAGSGDASGGGGGGAGTTQNGSNAVGMAGGNGGNLEGGKGGDGNNSIGFDGEAGLTFGGGGSGARKNTGWLSSNRRGGNGAAGAVRITYTIPECTGTPYAGILFISQPIGCDGVEINLKVTAKYYSDNLNGISHQWQESTDGVNWTDIAGETDPESVNYTTSSTVYFRLRVYCSHSGETTYSDMISYITTPCDSYNIDEHDHVTTCNALFFDSGGPNENYDHDEHEAIVFCSENGERLKAVFLEFNTEDNGQYGSDQTRHDYLRIYDGTDDSFPLLFEFSGIQTNSNKVPVVYSSQGCLAFVFRSRANTWYNTAQTRPGWKAHISCTEEVNNVAAQFCWNAPTICNLDGYEGNTSNFYNVERVNDQIADQSALFPQGILDNNSFITFVASAETVSLGVFVDNCTAGGFGKKVQFAIYSGSNCSGFTRISDANLVSYGLDEGDHTITLTGLIPGETYYVLVDGWNGAMCDYYITAKSGIDMPQIYVPNNGIFCAGESITLTASGGLAYTWAGPGGFTSDQAAVDVFDPGTYYVTITSGIPECPDDVIFSAYIQSEICCPPEGINEPENPNNPVICEGDEIPELTVDMPIGYDPNDYQINWYNQVVEGVELATGTNTYLPDIDSESGTYTFYAEVEQIGADCFSDRIPVVLSINPVISPTFQNLGPYCMGDNISDVLPNSSLNEPPINGVWTPSEINETVTTEYIFTPTDQGCYINDTMTIVIQEKITPVFEPLGPYCEGSQPEDELLNTSENNISGIWTPDVINTTGTTQYTFEATDYGCFNDVIIEIVIIDNITPSFDLQNSYCIGDEIELPQNSADTPPVAGTWEPSTINTTDEGISSYTFTPDMDECAEIITIDITINANVIPEFTQLGPYCTGQNPDILPAVSNNGIGGTWSPATINTSETGVSTYTFTPNENDNCYISITMDITIESEIQPAFANFGPYCLGDNPDILPSVSINGITGHWQPAIINTSVEGVSTYTFTPEHQDGCVSSIQINVIISNPLAIVQVSPPVCHGDIGKAVVNATGGVPPYYGMGTFNLFAGTHNIIVTDSHGCADTVTVVFTYPDLLVGSFVSHGPSCYGNNDGYIEFSASGGIEPYYFMANDIVSETNYISGLVGNETYDVYVYDANGCELYLGKAHLYDDPFVDCITIPNAFTPNGDGVNDEWRIKNIEVFPDATITVFNRWGHKVYNARGTGQSWDGTYKGRKLPTGSYMYDINLYHTNTDRDKYLGIVTIMY